MRLCFENWLKSDSSVISLISLKYVHFVHFSVEGSLLKSVARNHWKSVHLTLNGTAFGWKKLVFFTKICISFETKQEIT